MPYHAGWKCVKGHDRVSLDAPEYPRPKCPTCGNKMYAIRGYTSKDIAGAQKQIFGYRISPLVDNVEKESEKKEENGNH